MHGGYRIAGNIGRGKFGKFNKLSVINTIQINTYLLADLFNSQTFFAKCLKNFAKHFHCQTFLTCMILFAPLHAHTVLLCNDIWHIITCSYSSNVNTLPVHNCVIVLAPWVHTMTRRNMANDVDLLPSIL